MTTEGIVDFELLNSQLVALVTSESDTLANSALLVALLNDAMSDTNWLGLYIVRGRDLVLGPFQGKPACVRIPLGRGVCGVAASQGETLRIDDVHEFAGHIVCDAASNSELVVPLWRDSQVVGVLDIDSPTRGRFSARDQAGIESICRTFETHVIQKATDSTAPDRCFI